jgi:hypothetical protein
VIPTRPTPSDNWCAFSIGCSSIKLWWELFGKRPKRTFYCSEKAIKEETRPNMSFLQNLFGRNNPRKMIANLIRLVAFLRADDKYDASAPELMDYLRDKRTPDVVAAIKGCDEMLEQHKAAGSSYVMNPEIITNIREALVQEMKRRGETQTLGI